MKHGKSSLRLVLVATLFSFAALATACGDDGASGVDAGPTVDAGAADAVPICAEATQHSDFTWINANILQKNCGSASGSCHSSAPHTGYDLVLKSDVAYAQLVGADSKEVTKKLVAASSCADSYLFDKISNNVSAMKPGTMYMPRSSPMLCKEKIDAVCRWIAAGAMP